jgi:hypothetical protein
MLEKNACVARRPQMSVLANSAVCRRPCEEVLTNKQLGVIDEIYADQIAYGEGQSMPREESKMIAKAFAIAFRDLKVAIPAQIAEWDYVVTRWSATGIHLCDVPRSQLDSLLNPTKWY